MTEKKSTSSTATANDMSIQSVQIDFKMYRTYRNNFQCSKTKTNNELNAIIVDKVLKILELETVEKEKKLQTVGYDNNLISRVGFGSCVKFCYNESSTH